jgi:DNA modification methylase
MGDLARKNPLAVEWRALDSLRPYPKNARKIGQKAIDAVAESIQEFGWRQPIVVDSEGVIVIGHVRQLAAIKLALVEVPVHVADLPAAKIRALRLMDNRSHDEAQWDPEILTAEMLELRGLDLDLSMTGFASRELDALLCVDRADEDDVPPVPEAVVTRPGDLWLMGEHRVLCGDSTRVNALERLCGGKGDLLLTDPPYGMRLDADWSGCIGSIGQKRSTQGNKYAPVIGDGEDYDPGFLINFFKGVKEQFWFGADYYAERIPGKNAGSWLTWDKRKDSQADAIGSEFELIWSKTKHKRRMLRHDWFGFLSSGNTKEAQKRVHPTQKPTSLISDMLQQWATGCSSIVDPYLGSGSTLIACEKTQRQCLGMELSPDYVDVIVQRWQNFTGREATLEGHGATFAHLKDGRLREWEDALKEECLGR